MDGPARRGGLALLRPRATARWSPAAGGWPNSRSTIRTPRSRWRALFGKVWYEGYDRPEYVWQSTGGTDDFESKLGLTPLVIGTLKGTFYSLLIAIPLGVFGAMYASQFMHPRLKRVVKPTVEVMAALPSVVLGFLAGLWLAPRVESGFPALSSWRSCSAARRALPGVLWRALPTSFRGARPAGIEIFLSASSCSAGWLCVKLGRGSASSSPSAAASRLAVATRLAHLRPAQRRGGGLAMGFAVIPIIFAISEDAFSNVPERLISGSLALGADSLADRDRVVLPDRQPRHLLGRS